MSLFKNKPTLTEQKLPIEELLPNVPNHYIASNGVFRQLISTDIYREQQLSEIDNVVFTQSLNLQKGTETIKLLRGTLPYSFLHKIVEFFKYTYVNYLSEAVGVIYQLNENCTKEQLLTELSFLEEDVKKHLLFENDFVLLIPSQDIESSLVNFSSDIRYKIMDKCSLLTKKLELHSHHTMGAFFSTTDLNNQNDNCIYGVVGNIVSNVDILYSYHNNTDISTKDIFGQDYVPVPLSNYIATVSVNDESENDKELAKILPFPFEWTKCYNKIRSFSPFSSKHDFLSYVNHNVVSEYLLRQEKERDRYKDRIVEQDRIDLLHSLHRPYQNKKGVRKSEVSLTNPTNDIDVNNHYLSVKMTNLNINPLLPYNLTKEQYVMLHKKPSSLKQRYSLRNKVEIQVNTANKMVNKYIPNYTAILPVFLSPLENGYDFMKQRNVEHSTVQGKEMENNFYNQFSCTTISNVKISLGLAKQESTRFSIPLGVKLHETIFFAEDKIFTLTSVDTYANDNNLSTKLTNEFEAEVIFTMYELISDKAKDLYEILKQELIPYKKQYHTLDKTVEEEIVTNFHTALYDVLNECEYVTVNVNPYNNVKCTNYTVTASNDEQFNKFVSLFEQCYWSFNYAKPTVIDGR